MHTPVIFVHYGDSYYLKYTLKIAKLFNPNKKVILLGDESNKKYSSLGITHLYYDDYIKTDDVKEFNAVFKLIAGKEFIGGEKWTRFNFLKIFALKNLMPNLNINNFWIFDSDVLIIDDLSKHEHKFISYEYTYHNYNFVPQGLINSLNFLEKVTQFFISKFKDEKFIQENAKDFIKSPTFGLTYMRFFKLFNDINEVNKLRLNTIINDETFDECLFSDTEYENYDFKPFHYELKKIFFAPNGSIYTKHSETGGYIKNIALNLSWVETYIFKRIYKHALRSLKKGKTQTKFKTLSLMHLNKSEFHKWSNRFKNTIRKIKAN